MGKGSHRLNGLRHLEGLLESHSNDLVKVLPVTPHVTFHWLLALVSLVLALVSLVLALVSLVLALVSLVFALVSMVIA